MSAHPRRIIIDTDPSAGVPGADVDDILALAYAIGEPALSIEGVTVVAGNVELADGLVSALQALDVLACPHIPVHAGAARALVRDRTEITEFLRARRDDPLARELWRDVPPPASGRRPASARAAEFIVERVLAAPGEVTLVPIGPLTNVALALLLEPRVATSVREIVVMGGNLAGRHPGISAVEFNVANDPEAAHVVLTSGAPLTLLPLDVTTQTHLTLDDLAAATAADTPAARFVRRLAEPWIRYVQARRGIPGCWLHDPLAVVAAVDRAVVGTERLEVGVELRGEATYGLTLGHRPGLGRGIRQPRGGPVDVALTADVPRFMDRFLPALARAVSTPSRRREASCP
ncbi:MAG TPA: nucleoside hydrolase [Methylomirabilota bacterium]|nr:nucleoside hydrolase [Methylomirabilota bacterium]